MRIAGLDALKQAAERQGLHQARLRPGRRSTSRSSSTSQPFQKGFLGAEYATPDGQAATDGQRQGRHGADGPVGAGRRRSRRAARASATSSASSRSRGRGRQGRARPTCSAAATASRSARTRPPAAVDFLKFLLRRGRTSASSSQTGACCRSSRAPRARSRTRTCKAVADDRWPTPPASSSTSTRRTRRPSGQEVNDSVAALIAGTKTPGAGRRRSITKTAKTEERVARRRPST